MRKPIIAGNWKMYLNVDQSIDLIEEMLDDLDEIQGVDKVVCPSYVSLAPVAEYLEGSSVKLGAQNAHWEEAGAYTGGVSVLMLEDLCQYVILGHSERRQYFNETDELVNRKVRLAIAHNIKPIVCIGENLEQNEAGRTEEVVSTQLRGSLAGLDPGQVPGLVIAYEPVWAIGTGRAATGEGANAVIAMVRRLVGDMYGAEAADAVRIQYGGSVKSSNIAEVLSQPEIDGALVGGASLKADEFVSIVQQAAEIRGSKE
ncbi:MAG: triose-phosphate isomerase [Chloroflexi bacterium]|nr:triose-phosphate isomerase [Chloroflexota bacterium]